MSILKQAAVLRTLKTIDPSTINKNSLAKSSFSIEVEADDFQDNSRFESMDVFLSFVDTFIDSKKETPKTLDDKDISVSDKLFINVPASDFTIAENGKPKYKITISGQQIIELLGLDTNLDRIAVGGKEADILRVRLAMKLNDGSIYTSTNVANDVTGQFFSSSFRYDADLVCISAGDWTMNLADAHSNGWDDAFITVNIDGKTTKYTVKSGAEADFTFNVPTDTKSLTFTYTVGPDKLKDEHAFTITAPNGNIVKRDWLDPKTKEIKKIDLCNE